MAVINYYKFQISRTCFSVSNLQVYVTRVFHRKTVTVSSFHCTYYVVSRYFFFRFSHTFKLNAPKIHLRSRLKMSHCYIRKFSFELLLTLHVHIQALLRVDVTLQYASKKIKCVSLDTRKGLQFEFLLNCFNSFKMKVLIGSVIKFFHTHQFKVLVEMHIKNEPLFF